MPGTFAVWARRRSTDPMAQVVAEVAPWLAHVADVCGPLAMRVHHPGLRARLVEDGALPDGCAVADGLGLGPGGAWAASARADLHGLLEAQEARLLAGRVLYGASDGSTHPTGGGGAWAWVDQHGRWRAGGGPSDILGCELAGIARFAAAVDQAVFPRAVLFCDSLRAMDTVAASGPRLGRLPARFRDDVQTLRGMVCDGTLELVWTRGHAGHALNDVADRLALLRHRAGWLRMPASEVRAAGDRIVADTQTKRDRTDWGRVRRACLEARARMDTARQAA